MGEVVGVYCLLNLVFVMSMKKSIFYKGIHNKVPIDGDLYIRILTCNDVRNLKTSIKSEWGGGGLVFRDTNKIFLTQQAFLEGTFSICFIIKV